MKKVLKSFISVLMMFSLLLCSACSSGNSTKGSSSGKSGKSSINAYNLNNLADSNGFIYIVDNYFGDDIQVAKIENGNEYRKSYASCRIDGNEIKFDINYDRLAYAYGFDIYDENTFSVYDIGEKYIYSLKYSTKDYAIFFAYDYPFVFMNKATAQKYQKKLLTSGRSFADSFFAGIDVHTMSTSEFEKQTVDAFIRMIDAC